MESIIIVRRPQDIPTVKAILAKEPDSEVVTFDPVMLDHIFYEGISQGRYLPWQFGPEFAALEAEARGLATGMEARLHALVQPYLSDCDIRGWQFLHFYYLSVTLQWYSRLWDALRAYVDGYKVHVIGADNPAKYYFNTDLPACLLAQRLQEWGVAYEWHRYHDEKVQSGDEVLGLFAVREDFQPTDFLLTHLPTCVYDLLYFNKELAESGRQVVNLKAQHFNLPVWSQLSITSTDIQQVLDAMNPQLHHQIQTVVQIMRPEIDALLACWLKNAEHRAPHVEQIARTYLGQFCNWIMLTIYFLKSKPDKILLSDHDADLHGPIVSFAQNNKIPIFLLAHAKTQAYWDFPYENVTVLSHPIQGGPVLTRENRALPREALYYPEEHSIGPPPAAALNVLLVLNSISLNGVYYSQFKDYVEGVAQIVQWCKEKQMPLKIRGKPSYSIVRLLAAHTGFNLNHLIEAVTGEMDDFLKETDLCLMYDTPTSGCIKFLSRGIPIFNPVVHQLSHAESTFASPDLIPRGGVAQMLTQLDAMLQEEGALEAFRQRQFAQYQQACRQARPLRTWL